MRPNGLNVNKINIRHGGKQPIMRSSTLSNEHFGPFHSPSYSLQPGDTQSMTFAADDQGPCYLTQHEREKQRLDINTGKRKKCDLTKVELVKTLKSKGIIDPRGTKKLLQEQCTKLDIAIYKSIDSIREGWVGRPKGALQILFERGWINPDHIHIYSGDGKKTHSNVTTELSQDPLPTDPTNCNFSINSLMKLQQDFMQEITLLQYHAGKMGVIIDRTPKCHPEIAGEGVEYAWALAKLKYRRASIARKRNKAKFRNLVRECTNPLANLNILRVRSCSKKKRSYMKLYKAVQSVGLGEDMTLNKHAVLESSMKVYLKLKKVAKSHRSVADGNVRDVMEIDTHYNVVIDEALHKNGIKEEKQREVISELVQLMSCM